MLADFILFPARGRHRWHPPRPLFIRLFNTVCSCQSRKGCPFLPYAQFPSGFWRGCLRSKHPGVSWYNSWDKCHLICSGEGKKRREILWPFQSTEAQRSLSFVYPFSILLIHSHLTHSLLHPSGHIHPSLLLYLFIYSFIHSFIHWLIHSFIYPFTP